MQTDDDDDDDDMLLFIIVISVIGGLVLIGVLVWLLCCCTRSMNAQDEKAPLPARSVIPAFAPPTVIAAPSTQFQIIQEPERQGVAYLVDNSPNDVSDRRRGGNDVTNVAVAPPPIALKSRPRPRPRSVRVVPAGGATQPRIVPQKEPLFYPQSRAQSRPGTVRATTLGGAHIDSVIRSDIDANTYANY